MEEGKIQAIGEQIRGWSEVREAKYISASEAWESFKKEYFEGMEELADGFEADNPLANSASYEIYLKDISNQDMIVKRLEAIEGVRKVRYSSALVAGFTSAGKMIGALSAVIIGVLLAVSVFLISNTISVGITVRKDEIGIMKYIGATDAFVRAPFLLEGMILGLIGAGIPLIILYFCYNNVVTYVYTKFSVLMGVVDFIPVGQIYQTLVPVALALGIGIGLVGSFITTRKHLKV